MFYINVNNVNIIWILSGFSQIMFIVLNHEM